MSTQEILKQCTVEGNVVRLPDFQLDRKLYLDVKKSLELIGGKWKSRPVFGFVFQSDPTELLSQISNGVSRNLKKEYQYFATPEKLAIYLVSKADVKNDHKVLEPSAGQGAIVNAINRLYPNKPVFCYEAMPTNQTILNKIETVDFIGEDFLNPNGSGDLKFDRIIANPPFSKNQDIDHVKEMYSRLTTCGKLVSIMSSHWTFAQNKKETQFREWLEEVGAEVEEIPRGEFQESGTMVGGVIVTISKC